MVSVEYSEAMVEAIYILKNSSEDVISKIPINIIKFLKQNSSKTYIFEPDIDEELIIKPQTKAILAAIYRDYLCTSEEKIEYNKKLLENEKVIQEKLIEEFKDKEIFKNKSKTVENEKTETLLPVEVKNKSFISKIIDKIKKILKKQ